jgi:Fic family protein
MDSIHQHKWEPIEPLPEGWESLKSPELEALVGVWNDQAKELRQRRIYDEFLSRLRRQWAIETGILERLYTLNEGVTLTLIEKGLDASFIGHGDTDKSPELVVAIIKDQYRAIEGLYQFVGDERPLGTSYLKELHRILTANQETCDAINSLGQYVQVELIKGKWKTLPNDIKHDDGVSFQYCPPEHVDMEMEHLLCWHSEYENAGVPPEILAAWVHHRFTLIHPFQDGNGRVARCLATLILLKASWFPLVVTRNERSDYIIALRAADNSNLQPLVQLFSTLQRRAIRHALGLSEDVKETETAIQSVLASTAKILEKRKEEDEERVRGVLQTGDALQSMVAQRLIDVAGDVNTLVRNSDPTFSAYARDAKRSDEESRHNYFQTVQCAKLQGYFANLEAYRSWASLIITMSVRVEILFAFHGVGRDSRGILTCSAMAYQKEQERNESGGYSVNRIGEITPLSDEPFDFTYREEPVDVEKRFNKWLEVCLVQGLKYWKKTV